MNRVFVQGVGVVSPAGWGMSSFCRALEQNEPLPVEALTAPAGQPVMRVRRVPVPNPKPSFFAHPRLRRTSPIAQFSVGAALEALGSDQADSMKQSRLGIISCAFAGCVNYSRRFYEEVLREPSTASPLIFPETVFNAPSSHLSAFLGATGRNYTLVGDQGEFVKALALAADWLDRGWVDRCLITAAEELDWLTAGALELFDHGACAAEGAGALCLGRDPSPVELACVTEPQLYDRRRGGRNGRRSMAWPSEFSPKSCDLLCDGRSGSPVTDHLEDELWKDWPGKRCSPRRVFGEGLGVSGAWQVLAGIQALQRGHSGAVFVGVVGTNEQRVGAVFRRNPD
ncbi:MAG TPA: beta-ketoacyl synthase N-terminal-like domain-containing protein [Candidatus Limnocylindria bacterium]|nr:beta-ketoacyl synthase N-terminal-like domain-containing protein [Candidatus Limnocylindria bacterium]